MENNKHTHWIKFSLINFAIVALLGTLMRYKIGFEFPYFDQKHLQHAHSHFAFYGWVTHTLMLLMLSLINSKKPNLETNIYNKLIIFNLVASYGMLFSFILWGYNFISIFFSTFAIIISYIFTIKFIKDISKISTMASTKYWFISALLFHTFASIGTFVLAYLMGTHSFTQKMYLASVYFYLHFQYNGWFFFMIMGLFWMYVQKLIPNITIPSSIFRLVFYSCFINYGLSILWLQLPLPIYLLIVTGVVVQSIGVFWVFKLLFKNFFFASLPNKLLKYLFAFLGIAMLIKFSLQLFSIIPAISKLAFGFRPIVIAYLHLVLLAITSVFLITHLFANNYIINNAKAKTAIIVFTIGVLLNELILGIQGIASITYTVIPYVNYMLLAISVLIFIGLVLLIFSQQHKQEVTLTN